VLRLCTRSGFWKVLRSLRRIREGGWLICEGLPLVVRCAPTFANSASPVFRWDDCMKGKSFPSQIDFSACVCARSSALLGAV
jgi:hypothetical protein